MPGDKKKIKNPGARGGKYYINDKGEVIYGEKPTGKKGKVVDEKGGEHNRNVYDSKKTFKDQFPSFEEFNRRAKEKGLAELDAKAYKQIYQREHKEYMKHVGEAGTKGQKGLDDKTRGFLENRITFDNDGFHTVGYDKLNERYKEIHGKELSKEDYMKVYKEQKYKHSKFLKDQEKSKTLTHTERAEKLKKELFDDNSDMHTETMNKLPKLDKDENGDGGFARDEMFIEAFINNDKTKSFLKADEYETYKNALSVYFANTDSKFWEEQKKGKDSGVALPFAIDIAMAEYAKNEDSDKAWKLYSDYSSLFDRFDEMHEYYNSGADKVEIKKEEAKKKKEQRDKEFKTLNKVDKERKAFYDEVEHNTPEVVYKFSERLHQLGVQHPFVMEKDPKWKDLKDMGLMPKGASILDKEQWDEMSKIVGHKILDGEKEDFFNRVVSQALLMNKSIDESFHIDKSDRKKIFDSFYVYGVDESRFKAGLQTFLGKRRIMSGKTFETPLEKTLYATKKEFDDKLDSIVDMKVISDIVSSNQNDPEYYKLYKDIFDKSSSVSETIHNVHTRRKELDAVIDKYRNPFKGLNSGENYAYTDEEKQEWNSAVREKYAWDKFNKQLNISFNENSDIIRAFGINTFFFDGGKEIGNQIDKMKNLSPETKVASRTEDALTFMEEMTNRSSSFYNTVEKVQFKDLRTADESELGSQKDRYRAFARGSQIYINHEYVDTGTIIHEFGHALETDNKSISMRCADFYLTRTDDLQRYKLKDLYPKSSYGDKEVAYVDSFTDPYVGRDYESEQGIGYSPYDRARNPHGLHEVFSMGVQNLYENPIEFMLKDPEHFLITKTALKI